MKVEEAHRSLQGVVKDHCHTGHDHGVGGEGGGTKFGNEPPGAYQIAGIGEGAQKMSTLPSITDESSLMLSSGHKDDQYTQVGHHHSYDLLSGDLFPEKDK